MIKWGNPFHRSAVSVRLLRAQGALQLRAHPGGAGCVRKELKDQETTKNFLKLPYDKPLPEKLIRKIEKYRLKNIGEGDGFWA